MPLGLFRRKQVADKLDAIVAMQERQLRAIESMVAAFAQATTEQAKVVNTVLGMYAISEPPTTRLNGDQYQLSLAESHRLALLGYPATGTEREQLEWMLLHPEHAAGYAPLDR